MALCFFGSLKLSFIERKAHMAQYIISYLGGDQPSSPEEGKQHFAKYNEWLSSLGKSVVSASSIDCLI